MQSNIGGGKEHFILTGLTIYRYHVCDLNSLGIDTFTTYWAKILEIQFHGVGKKKLNKASLLSK